ncbi:MAG: cytochrome b/b6 domain-containing protein [Deltaproteobacteria bacterium]|nr:cytochrome b/b6 domain-containing protein [Deltaproteobacteria bacterium]
MREKTRILRFSVFDRLFHLFIMVTFLIQAVTGMGRLLYATTWGKWVVGLFGSYETATAIHNTVGILMMIAFAVHIVYVLFKVEWRTPGKRLFHPDSLVPRFQDVVHLGQKIRWFLGLGPPPQFDRWTYWEKFDYWAVFWGLPLLGVTGLVLMYPVGASRYMPGWSLNVMLLLHRAEALLAMLYIFIIHFSIGHLRRGMFPMNECMFAGSVELEKELKEKPAWIARLQEDGRLEEVMVPGPPTWYRVMYFVFGYAVLTVGIYLLIVIINYRNYIEWH